MMGLCKRDASAYGFDMKRNVDTSWILAHCQAQGNRCPTKNRPTLSLEHRPVWVSPYCEVLQLDDVGGLRPFGSFLNGELDLLAFFE